MSVQVKKQPGIISSDVGGIWFDRGKGVLWTQKRSGKDGEKVGTNQTGCIFGGLGRGRKKGRGVINDK